MKFLLSIVMGVVMMLCASTALAEQEIIEADGSYVMDSRLDETAASATARAREEAKRAAVDKAGVYLEAYAKTVNMELERDEIRTVTAHFLKVLEEKPSVAVIQDNLLEFTVHIKALVDVSDAERLKAMMQDKTQLEIMSAQNRELQTKYDELKAQMEALKKNYDSADESQRAQLKREAARNDEIFKAMQLLEEGNGFYLSGDYSRALDCYNRSIDINRTSADAYDNRGLTYYHLNRTSEAIADFTRAIELNNSFAYAYNNRGLARQAAGSSEAALADYTRALSINPKFVVALNNRANTYAALGQSQNALNDLQAALNLEPSSAEAHNNLGSVYVTMNRLDEALSEYSTALKLKPNYASAFYNRGWVYYRQGKYSEALNDAQRAAALEPNNSAFRELVGRVQSKLSR